MPLKRFGKACRLGVQTPLVSPETGLAHFLRLVADPTMAWAWGVP